MIIPSMEAPTEIFSLFSNRTSSNGGIISSSSSYGSVWSLADDKSLPTMDLTNVGNDMDYSSSMDNGGDSDGQTTTGGLISQICRQAARYYVAVVIVFGVLGNAGCLLCYRRSEELKRYRSTGYLMALAISDMTFLLCLSLIWLKSMDINWHDAQVVCQTSVYASNASIFLSAWYVMALTGEMAFALRRPYRAYLAAVDASKTVLLRILLVTIVGLAVNSWTLALTKTGIVYLDGAQSAELQKELLKQALQSHQFEHAEVGVIEGEDELEPILEHPDYDGHDHQLPSGAAHPHLTDEDAQMLWESLLSDNETFPPLSYDPGCHISAKNDKLHKTFVLLDIVFTYCIPLIITLLLNCYIGYKLIQTGRQRRHMSHRCLFERRSAVVCQFTNLYGQQQTSLVNNPAPPSPSLNRKRRLGQQLDRCPFTPMELNRLHTGQMSSTRKISSNRATQPRNKEAAVSSLLIAKSMAYLIFNTPSCAHRIWSVLKREQAGGGGKQMGQQQQQGGNDQQNWVYTIIYMLFFTQFSINFLLYSWHAYARRKCGARAAKAILKSYQSPAPVFK